MAWEFHAAVKAKLMLTDIHCLLTYLLTYHCFLVVMGSCHLRILSDILEVMTSSCIGFKHGTWTPSGVFSDVMVLHATHQYLGGDAASKMVMPRKR